MKDKSANLPEDLGARALFVCMNEEYVGNVVNRILSSLGRASPESKRAFETELDNLNLRIPGFRNASVALRSNPQRLKDPVRHSLTLSDKLAAAALEVWVESHQHLRQIVGERIDDIGTYIGVSAEPADLSQNGLRGSWPKRSWERERERFATLHDDYDEDDLALMMCYVSGRLPGMEESGGESEAASDAVEQLPDILNLLALCAGDLEELPVSAPEWESDIPELAEKIAKIVRAKLEERNRAATLDSFIAEIRDDFSAELAYLESDTSSWSAADLSDARDISKALSICEELRSALTEYRTARESPPAPTRSENIERRNRIDQLEDCALNLLDRIGRLMSGEPIPDDDPPTRPARSEEQAEPEPPRRDEEVHISRFPDYDLDHLARENISLKSEIDSLKSENESLRTKNELLETEGQTMKLENIRLGQEIQFIQADNADIKRGAEALRSKLTVTENDAETWRLAYEEESRIPRMTVKDVPMHIENVSDAVKYAEDMFPDRLLLKTNSKSQVRDNPFEKPEDVWEALKWLATAYRDARAGVSSVPDFDLSVRETCGWQYKSDQHETTRNKYREWYTTKTNNKTYWLLEHIGTGASKDARHTIRIAFDWDKDEKLVVVGYIGQHQRTDAT